MKYGFLIIYISLSQLPEKLYDFFLFFLFFKALKLILHLFLINLISA